MSPRILIEECNVAGVSVWTDGNVLNLRGTPDAVKAAKVRLLPYKAALLAYLTSDDDLDIWGEFTPYCCPIDPEIVRELHSLIAKFAVAYRLSAEATAEIISDAKHQSAASVPTSVDWFKAELKKSCRPA